MKYSTGHRFQSNPWRRDTGQPQGLEMILQKLHKKHTHTHTHTH